MTQQEPQNTQILLQPGDTLVDRYQLTHQLGAGGYSQVFAADDLKTGKAIALKVLHRNAEKHDPSAMGRMQQESQILSKLNHPHIVSVYDFQRTDEGMFIVMEKLLGRNIAQSIELDGPFTGDRVYPLVKQLLDALDCAHDARVLHRDIKPQNIILCPDEAAQGGLTAILVDFGLAKGFVTSGPQEIDAITMVLTKTEGFMGTPRYTPPEQALGDALSPATDLFALGLVIGELLTGHVRIQGSRHVDIMTNLMNPQPVDVSDCPRSWQPWLAKMLQKDPLLRYQNAQEASLALDHTLTHKPNEGSRELVFDPNTGAFVSEDHANDNQILGEFIEDDEPLELDLPPTPPLPVVQAPELEVQPIFPAFVPPPKSSRSHTALMGLLAGGVFLCVAFGVALLLGQF